ncbi:MAG: hypothetical protein R3Y56_07325 [Akkermansia sp.]
MNYLALSTAALCCLTAPISFAADSAPANHAESYKKFVAQLDTIQQSNSRDLAPAMDIVLSATKDELAARAWMEKAAAAKHPVALTYMSNYLVNSAVVDPVDPTRAKKQYEMVKQAASAGYIPAIVNESICLFTGQGVARNEATALRKLMEACKENDNFARFTWLQMSKRLATAADLQRPEVQAEIKRNNDLVILFAHTLTNKVEEQLGYLRQAAELKNPDAIFALSQVLGKSKPADSLILLQEAARLHHPNAMAIIGTIMTRKDDQAPMPEGIDIPRDPAQGLQVIKLSSMLDCPLASNMLGELYHKGDSTVAADQKRAHEHFRTAAFLNNPSAALTYSWMLMEGVGCKANPKLGVELCQRMLQSNLPQAKMLMAYAYYKGLGVTEDGVMATDLLQEAAAQQMPQAYIFLAFITQKGCKGLTADKSQADTYVRMASLDMKEKANEFYQKMLQAGEWKYRD